MSCVLKSPQQDYAESKKYFSKNEGKYQIIFPWPIASL